VKKHKNYSKKSLGIRVKNLSIYAT